MVRRGAREGLLAAAVALAVYWAAARAYPQLGFAPFALADRVVRVTPGGVATWFIDHLHHNDQRLLAGVAVALLGHASDGAFFGVLVWLAGRPSLAAPLLDRPRALKWIGSSTAAVIGGLLLSPLV